MGDKQRRATDTEKLRRRNRELSILHAIAEALNHEVDLSRALRTALSQVADVFDLHTGWIYLLDEQTDKFYIAATLDLPPALGDNPRRLGGTCHCLDTYREGDMEGAANINIITCTRLKDLVDGTDGLRYHASIPLYAYGKQLGVLNVASTDWSGLSPDDLELLKTIGDMISIAIQRARLFAQSARFGALEERNRLARELHDTLAQGLTAISLQLETADALMEEREELDRVHKLVCQALDETRRNLEEARRSVLDLRAAPLEDRSLAEALAALIEECTTGHDITTSFDVVDEHPLPLRVEVGLYRIAQEALTNAMNHADPSQLKVQLMTLPNKVELRIEDNGKGFEPDQIPKGRYGLIGQSERAKLLGGAMQIRSAPGGGTRIEVTIPLGSVA